MYKPRTPLVQGQWLFVLQALAPQLNDAIEKMPKHVPCPVHGGKDGFRLFKDANDTGGGICNSCGGFNSGWKLLQWVNNWSYVQCRDAIKSLLGKGTAPVYLPKASSTNLTLVKPEPNTKQLLLQQKLWQEAYPLNAVEASLALTYFENRGLKGINQDFPATIRFHPSLAYWEQGKQLGNYPALVSQVLTIENTWISLHRTYLDFSGNKADLPSSKKLMPAVIQGAFKGSAIPLYPVLDSACLAVTEGIETALAIRLATKLPVWAAGNATLLGQMLVPSSIKQVFIMADNDLSGAGEKAARSLQQRLVKQNIDARLVMPDRGRASMEKSVDWLDIWQKEPV